MYLGDGMLTLAPRNVWRLRIVLDQKYPGIIERCESAIGLVASRGASCFCALALRLGPSRRVSTGY